MEILIKVIALSLVLLVGLPRQVLGTENHPFLVENKNVIDKTYSDLCNSTDCTVFDEQCSDDASPTTARLCAIKLISWSFISKRYCRGVPEENICRLRLMADNAKLQRQLPINELGIFSLKLCLPLFEEITAEKWLVDKPELKEFISSPGGSFLNMAGQPLELLKCVRGRYKVLLDQGLQN